MLLQQTPFLDAFHLAMLIGAIGFVQPLTHAVGLLFASEKRRKNRDYGKQFCESVLVHFMGVQSCDAVSFFRRCGGNFDFKSSASTTAAESLSKKEW